MPVPHGDEKLRNDEPREHLGAMRSATRDARAAIRCRRASSRRQCRETFASTDCERSDRGETARPGSGPRPICNPGRPRWRWGDRHSRPRRLRDRGCKPAAATSCEDVWPSLCAIRYFALVERARLRETTTIVAGERPGIRAGRRHPDDSAASGRLPRLGRSRYRRDTSRNQPPCSGTARG